MLKLLRRAIAACGCMSALAMPVQAESLSYRYVQLDYGWVDVESGTLVTDREARRLRISGSLPITDKTFVVISGANADSDGASASKVVGTTDTCAADVESSARSLRVGGGLRWPLRTDTDIVLELALMDAEIECGGQSRDDSGGAGSLYLRHEVEPGVEMLAGAERREVFGEKIDGISLAIFSRAPSGWSMGLGYQRDDNVRSVALILRANL